MPLLSAGAWRDQAAERSMIVPMIYTQSAREAQDWRTQVALYAVLPLGYGQSGGANRGKLAAESIEGEISIHIADLCRHTAAYTIFCVPSYALAHCELWNNSTG